MIKEDVIKFEELIFETERKILKMTSEWQCIVNESVSELHNRLLELEKIRKNIPNFEEMNN